jgi:hypothetical protein
LDEALNDLEMGEGNRFLSLRGSLLDAQGEVRKDIFKPRGDIHLNAAGTQIVSLRIRKMLEIMLPNLVPVQTSPAPVPVPVQTPVQVQTPLAPVQTLPAKVQRTRVQAPVPDPAPVVVNEQPPVVNATLVAAVIQAPVVNDPAVVQNIAVPETSTEMEVEEDEDALLARLFFKRFGRALPEKEKEKEKDNEVDNIKFVIDLTDDTDEMEADPTPILIPNPVVKTEPIEIANVTNVTGVTKRRSFRLERLELAKARKAITDFGKSLRKKEIIPEKEAPENVIADNDTDMAEDVSVNNVETVEQTIAASEAAIAATNAAIADNQREFAAEFGDTPIDEFDD